MKPDKGTEIRVAAEKARADSLSLEEATAKRTFLRPTDKLVMDSRNVIRSDRSAPVPFGIAAPRIKKPD
jgi:hypothetical protein